MNNMTNQESKTREEPSASEALFGFAGWLTTRDERVTASAQDDAAIWAELVGEFCKANDLTEPRDGWEKILIHPTSGQSAQSRNWAKIKLEIGHLLA